MQHNYRAHVPQLQKAACLEPCPQHEKPPQHEAVHCNWRKPPAGGQTVRNKQRNLYMRVCVLVTQWYLALCNPMDCSLPGSSVHGILQARILKWIAIPVSRGHFHPRDRTWVSCIAGRFFIIWATREALLTGLFHHFVFSLLASETLDPLSLISFHTAGPRAPANLVILLALHEWCCS